jgi:hypothetical protein
MAYITPVMGWKGYVQLQGVQIPFLTASLVNPDNNLIPPLVQNSQWPLTYAAGIRVPMVNVTTHPMQHWWTKAGLGTFFFRESAETLPVGSVLYNDGYGSNGTMVSGVKGNNLQIVGVQGGLVTCSFGLMGITSTSDITAAGAGATTTPARTCEVSFGTSTGVSRFAFNLSNSLRPDNTFSGCTGPNGIDEGPQVASLEITQRRLGVAIASTESITMVAGTKTPKLDFQLLQNDVARNCSWDETQVTRTFPCYGATGMTPTWS